MKDPSKYSAQYYDPPAPRYNWVKKGIVERAPAWCSVDLRDGNQALIIPMSLDEKLKFFKLLVDIGFKEIEVGFPAASETEYRFLRTLIEKDLIPDDVTVQVLTQSREHIIKKTFDSLVGVRRAVVHLYNSISVAQREQVFCKSKDEIKQIAVDGARLFEKYAGADRDRYVFEYSPESFTGTEPEYALEVCNAVLDVWQPTEKHKVIINLPATVELSLPHIYANQIEYISENIKYRENVIISLHPHNDRGCAVADTELGILAGADRVEGTLFGNGERTGNADIVTLALNMYTHGVDPKLDFSDMPGIVKTYESVTRMHVDVRSPYSGSLVFAAFSGSHQDAIAKGLRRRKEQNTKRWTVPYLPLDPSDVGRVYETDVIRINSQSGKGGIGYVLERDYGYRLPKGMCEKLSYAVKGVSDREHRELSSEEVFGIFKNGFVNVTLPLKVVDFHFNRLENEQMEAFVTVVYGGETMKLKAVGNGRIDSVSNALKKLMHISFSNLTYTEHALEKGSASKAVSYVGITADDGKVEWGAGIHNDIVSATVRALVTAVNRQASAEKSGGAV